MSSRPLLLTVVSLGAQSHSVMLLLTAPPSMGDEAVTGNIDKMQTSAGTLTTGHPSPHGCKVGN
jgi:hypothetical protein